jgi:signal transduction histidine kinase
MDILSNFDLLTVGVALAANILIGFAVFFSKKNSATNRLFLIQTLVLAIWSFANYLSYQPHDANIALILVRLVLFFAVPNSVIFLLLMHTFPSEQLNLSRRALISLSVITIIVMCLTLSPILFVGVQLSDTGAPVPIPGPGLIPFFIVAILSLPLGIFYLIKNLINSHNEVRKQLFFLLIGVVMMFSLIIIFNFIFPALLQNSRFIPLSALFTFPFVAFTAYAIYRHKLFNIKDIVTVFAALALTVVTFIEIIFSTSFSQIIFRSSVFVLVLIFSIQLIRNMFNLEFANDRLKELDQLKTEFISLATHQIRSPLTAIKGYISLILEGDYGTFSDKLKEPLDIILQSTNNLVTIVGDFLDVSRIEQGRMKYDFSDFDLQELAAEVVTEYEPNIHKRGLTSTYTFEHDKNYTVHGDRGKIKQIIGNIIDNSIKYTPKGSIAISLTNNGQKILIKIADTGIGISPKTMPKLFQKFSRADNANDTNILGTGLGLYVAQQMIVEHGGRIWAESEGEGKGSQFYIELNTLKST